MKRIAVPACALFFLTTAFMAGQQQTQQQQGQQQQGQQQQGQQQQGQRQGGGRGGGGQAADPRDIGGGRCAANPFNCVDTPNPLPAPNTVWLEEMTWMDVRDAMKAGKTTMIITTGGIEPNGPWLALGKHNYVLRANCDAIARKLGNALCAPIVKFVPRGDIDPPTHMMRFPGTISLTEETYKAMMTEIVRSLLQHGFKHVILISDSGEKQPVLQAIAEKVSRGSKPGAGTVNVVVEYKVPRRVLYPWLKQNFQWEPKKEGLHDDPIASTQMMAVNPDLVRIKEREAKGLASIDGISLLPVEKAVEAGRKLAEFRGASAAAVIRKIQAGEKPAAR
jgi:creatinine amidohydrolase/Fe(II)-dependent formamide hydrolase-like protein